MTQTLLILSAIFTVGGLIPYIRDMVRRKTKPRIVSWFNWTLLTIIATTAALTSHQYASAVLTAAAATATGAVVILSLRYASNKKFEALDIICQVGAIVGLILWALFNNPAVAIAATVIIDFIVGLPTWKHAWVKPFEETASSFAASSIGGTFAFMAALASKDLLISGLLFPAYIALNNAAITGLIVLSPNRYER